MKASVRVGNLKNFFCRNFNLVRYNSNVEIVKGDNTPLQGDHTHFLLIDDGARYRFFSAYTDFITRFEMMVREPETNVSNSGQ